MDQLEQGKPRRPVWRLRDRIFIVLTANLALACAWATYHVSQVRVLDPCEYDLVMAAYDSPGEVFAALEEANRRIASIKVIVHVWRHIMWSVAAFLELVALLAAITRKGRLLHLLAAGVILLSTKATLVGMNLLSDPGYGGMEPLAIRYYLYVAAIQSAYGVVLLFAFVHKPAPVHV